MKLTPEDVRLLQERKRSNAAGKHRDKRTKRQTRRTVVEREERAMNASAKASNGKVAIDVNGREVANLDYHHAYDLMTDISDALFDLENKGD